MKTWRCLLWILVLTSLSLAGASAQSWAVRYSGGEDCFSSKIRIGSDGSSYVAGTQTRLGVDRVLLIRYKPGGVLTWKVTYGGADTNRAFDMALDASDNIYLAGLHHGDHGNDFLILKYSPSGTLLWEQIYDGTASGVDNAKAIQVDSAGNVYVAGFVTNTNRDFAVIKYNTNGVFQWSYLFDGGDGNESANALALDSANNVVAVGQVTRAGRALDYYTVKLNGATGAPLWRRFYDRANINDFATAVAVDSSGNVLVTGRAFNALSILDYVTIKYTSTGAVKWAKRYDSGGHDAATAIATDTQGNVYVTGESWANDVTRADWLTIKYNSDGLVQWKKRQGTTGEDSPSIINVDASYNVFVGGYINRAAGAIGATPEQDAYLAKYNSAGSIVFTARYNGAANNMDSVVDFALFQGDIYATLYSYTGVRGNIVTRKYDQTP